MQHAARTTKEVMPEKCQGGSMGMCTKRHMETACAYVFTKRKSAARMTARRNSMCHTACNRQGGSMKSYSLQYTQSVQCETGMM